MSMNTQGRPSAPAETASTTPQTFTGNKALMIEEALIFEIGDVKNCGVDIPEPPKVKDRLGKLKRKEAAGLPGLS
ncbi:MAG: aminomethyl-transferring glycine dehydrogenase subunit GcvPB, partial [Rhodobiaceae bacterium]|nr:aminomethyl-transferring glycine dehydrogenase subunit GcvPB [Rhodobiaceae bacterium]